MSDAEYYMEQQEEEARFQQASEDAAREGNSKLLLCWTDKLPGEEVWSWKPMSTILGIFAELHQQKQIGTEYFIASQIPTIDDDEWDDEEDTPLQIDSSGELKMVDKWEFVLAQSEHVGLYEVLVVSRHDINGLHSEAKRQQVASKTLKQRMLAEMLEAMAAFINEDGKSTIFVFARMV
jgi:hypothetical protein